MAELLERLESVRRAYFEGAISDREYVVKIASDHRVVELAGRQVGGQVKQEMIDLMTKIYGEAYSAEYIAETVNLYLAGVRDVRLPDIAVTLLDKYGFYGLGCCKRRE